MEHCGTFWILHCEMEEKKQEGEKKGKTKGNTNGDEGMKGGSKKQGRIHGKTVGDGHRLIDLIQRNMVFVFLCKS